MTGGRKSAILKETLIRPLVESKAAMVQKGFREVERRIPKDFLRAFKQEMEEKRRMTYEELVQEIRDIFSTADVSGVKEHIAYQFNIQGEAQGAFYAEISDGKLHIEPYEYYDRDVLFTSTADTLLKIVRGKLNAVHAFTVGKLKVEGDFDKALKLQEFAGK